MARNPSLKNGSEREVYQELLVKQTEVWIREWPEDPQPRYERFMAMRMMQDAPLEDTVNGGGRLASRLRSAPRLHVAVHDRGATLRPAQHALR